MAPRPGSRDAPNAPARLPLMLLAAVLALAPLTSAEPLAPPGTIPWDDPYLAQPGSFLDGALTWNGGPKGGITWGGTGADSQDNQPPDPRTNPTFAGQDTSTVEALSGVDMDEAAYDWDRYLNQPDSTCFRPGLVYWPCVSPPLHWAGTPLAPSLGTTQFVSQPLAETVYVDITKGFQLELALKIDPDADPNHGGSACQRAIHNEADATTRPLSDNGFPAPAGVATQTIWIEPGLEVELRATTNGVERIVGGTITEEQKHWNFDPFNRVHPDARAAYAGYNICYFHMHPEELVLEEGTVLTLGLKHVRQAHWFPIGMKDGHVSKLRVWKYSSEEVLYRYPVLAPESPEEGEGSVSQDGSFGAGSAPILVLAAVPALAGSLRRRRTAVLLIVVALFASGCLNGQGAEQTRGAVETGLIENTIVPDSFNLSAAGTGSILGLVQDEYRQALGDVTVLLYGTAGFTQSGPDGRFQFYNVTPGHHKLRFDKPTFKSYEAPVEVKAQSVSKPVVTLYPKVAKFGDERLHPHDNWNGRDEIVLPAFELPLPTCVGSWTECRTDPWATSWDMLIANEFNLPAPVGENKWTIPPGTWLTDFTFNWQPGQWEGIDRIGLRLEVPLGVKYGGTDFEKNIAKDRMWWGTQVNFAARGPNQPFHVRTAWEMTDNGHAAVSDWRLSWWIPVGSQPKGQAYDTASDPSWNPPRMTVTMKLHRGGVLPLEPGHRDPWKGADVIEMTSGFVGAKRWDNDAQPLAPVPGESPADCTDLPIYRITGYGDYWSCYEPRYPTWYIQNWEQGKGVSAAVPHDAVWMEAKVTRSRDPDPNWFQVRLWYHPGELVDNTKEPNEVLENYFPLEPVSSEQSLVTTYRFKVPEAHKDAIYTTQSWRFAYRPIDDEARRNEFLDDLRFYQVDGQTGEGSLLQYSLSVKVYKTPWPG